MIILDSDHLSILQQPKSTAHERLVAAMAASLDQDFATTAISLEEQMRGWLAAINRKRKVHDQTLYYTRLTALNRFYCRWKIMSFDEPAADKFESLRRSGVRIGTMDLKIAATVLAHGGILWSANLKDFAAIPNLSVVDRLH